MPNERRKNGQRGVIAIEAAISLFAFLLMFVILYSVVDIARKQLKVEHALAGAAKELSEYMYMYQVTGLKLKEENLHNETELAKIEVKENVADNFISIMDGVGGLKDGGSSLFSTVTDPDTIPTLIANPSDVRKTLAGDAETIKGSATEIKNGAEGIVTYLKTNLGDAQGRKEFLKRFLSVAASDGFDIIKNALGGVLAEQMCKSYFTTEAAREFFDTIDFGNSMLFPAGTDFIILRADYEVSLVPLLNVDFTRTVSQQVVTTGWLDGDGHTTDKKATNYNRKKISELQENLWTGEFSGGVNERAKLMRTLRAKETDMVGCYEISGASNIHLYNRTDNEVIYVGSSNVLWGMEKLTDLTVDGKCDDSIKAYYDSIVGNVDSVPTTLRIKQKDANGNITSETVNTVDRELHKTLDVTVPEDEGVKEYYQKIWDENYAAKYPDIKLQLNASYGTYFVPEPAESPEGETT